MKQVAQASEPLQVQVTVTLEQLLGRKEFEIAQLREALDKLGRIHQETLIRLRQLERNDRNEGSD